MMHADDFAGVDHIRDRFFLVIADGGVAQSFHRAFSASLFLLLEQRNAHWLVRMPPLQYVITGLTRIPWIRRNVLSYSNLLEPSRGSRLFFFQS